MGSEKRLSRDRFRLVYIYIYWTVDVGEIESLKKHTEQKHVSRPRFVTEVTSILNRILYPWDLCRGGGAEKRFAEFVSDDVGIHNVTCAVTYCYVLGRRRRLR